MITPSFKVAQDDNCLTIVIRAPYTNVKETEIEYYEKTFLFSSKPYFLRLFLPKEVVDDESGTADYDADSGQFTVKVPKRTRGEFFPNLDMLTELIKPQQSIGAERLVQEVVAADGDDLQEAEEAEVPDDELYANQGVTEDGAPYEHAASHECGYGFGWLRHGVLGKFADDIRGLLDLDNPDELPIADRAALTCDLDIKRFDSEHYLSDLFEPSDGQQEALNFHIDQQHLALSDADRNQLKDLRVRKLENLDKEASRSVSLLLVDVLIAYCYDLRTTDGEHTVESSWTIAKLAPSLSCLVRWTCAEEAVITAVRRSLVYPLYRNWELSRKVLEDVKDVLDKGRPAILHCLLDVRQIMNNGGEFRYLFSQLYFDDYNLWIQSVSEDVIQNLRKEYEAALLAVTKDSLTLDLEVLEAEARMTLLGLEDAGSRRTAASEALDSDDEAS